MLIYAFNLSIANETLVFVFDAVTFFNLLAVLFRKILLFHVFPHKQYITFMVFLRLRPFIKLETCFTLLFIVVLLMSCEAALVFETLSTFVTVISFILSFAVLITTLRHFWLLGLKYKLLQLRTLNSIPFLGHRIYARSQFIIISGQKLYHF